MTDDRSLDEFTEEHGTTDELSGGDLLDPPDDGHLRRENGIHDYWRGTAEHFGSTHPGYSIVPPGRVIIVLAPGDDAVERGWGSDAPLERGVYLSGRGDIGSAPPAPVDVDDDHLRFAADAALLAVSDAADEDDEVVAISMDKLSLSFAVRGHPYDYQEYVIETTDEPITYPDERPDELYHGFVRVRRFGTPYKAYTKAEVPRLALEDLNVEWSP